MIYEFKDILSMFSQGGCKSNDDNYYEKWEINEEWCPPSDIFAFHQTHPPNGDLRPIATPSVVEEVQDMSDMVMAIIAAQIMLS